MNTFANFVRVISPDCKEAVRLQSEALDRPLTGLQRVGLRIHLVLCVWCRRYGKQIGFLRTAARQCDHEFMPNHSLSAEARERIKRTLRSGKD